MTLLTPLSRLTSLTLLSTSIFTSGILLSGCDSKEEPANTAAPIPLKVVNYMIVGAATNTSHNTNNSTHPSENALTPSVRTLSGQVISAETTKIGFEANGNIIAIVPTMGSRVTKGQLLGEIDSTNYQLKAAQAQAQLTQATNSRKKAEIDVSRRENLISIGAVSKSEVDSVRLALRSAIESERVAKADLELVKKQISDTRLYAPFTGVITDQLSEVGQFASPGMPVLALASDDTKEVRISVPENLLPSVGVGQPMLVNFPAIDVQAKGKVTEVSSQASSGSFPVTIKLINPANVIKSGMTAEVAFHVFTPEMRQIAQAKQTNPELVPQLIKAARSFPVPPSALGANFSTSILSKSSQDASNSTEHQDNPNNYVFKINKSANGYKLEKVKVSILDINGNAINIQGGVKAGDLIVKSGVSLLEDGQEVELMGEGARRTNP